jgi:predicted transcriptional regulator
LSSGESLSGLVEESLQRNIQFSRSQEAFIARGLASRDAAKISGKYISAEKVLKKLSAILKKAQRKQAEK